MLGVCSLLINLRSVLYSMNGNKESHDSSLLGSVFSVIPWKVHAVGAILLISAPWIIRYVASHGGIPHELSEITNLIRDTSFFLGIASLIFAGLAWRYRNYSSDDTQRT